MTALGEEERKERNRQNAKAWYWANREYALRRDRAKREADPEKAREQARQQYERTGREYQRQRRRENPEQFRVKRRERYLADREKENEQARAWQQAHPERVRELKREDSRRRKRANPQGESERFQRMKRARLHGMQPEDYAAVWDAQGGCCYLCGDDLGALQQRFVHVDHDHRCCPKETSCTVCRRGLACYSCNSLVGMARDDPDRLRRIAGNLEVALAGVAARLAAKPVQASLLDEETA